MFRTFTYRLLQTYASTALCAYCRVDYTSNRYAVIDQDGIERDRAFLCKRCAA